MTVNGSSVRADRDANERFYGKRLDTGQIILQEQADAREPVPQWLEVLNLYARP